MATIRHPLPSPIAPRAQPVYLSAGVEGRTGVRMRRVVITGLGMLTPLACGVEATWSRLLAGQSGAGTITKFDASHLQTTYACEIPRGDGSDGTFNPDDWMEPKDQRKVDDFILYGMTAAVQAVKDSGWEPTDEHVAALNAVAHRHVSMAEYLATFRSRHPPPVHRRPAPP